jgi:LysW-gamma-L-lysine carboxypeptidase
VRRPPAHPASPTERASEVAAAFWADIAVLGGSTAPDGHGRFDRIGATLHEMHGDLESARLRIVLRLPVGVPAERVVERLRRTARGGRLDVLASTDPVVVDRNAATVRALRAGIRRAGGTPRLKLKSGTGDMNVFAARWPTPAATYGPGDSRLDHSADEHLEIPDFLRAIDVVSTALNDLAR